MKKACSVLLSVLLIFTMQLCVFAEAGEIGKTQLKTVVPSTHEITVTYNDGGYVLKDGNLIASGAKFAVDRFDSLSLGAVAKLDSHLERVTVNGKDYTDKLQYGMLRFDSVTTDMNIVFTFKKMLRTHRADYKSHRTYRAYKTHRADSSDGSDKTHRADSSDRSLRHNKSFRHH